MEKSFQDSYKWFIKAETPASEKKITYSFNLVKADLILTHNLGFAEKINGVCPEVLYYSNITPAIVS